MFVKEVFWTTVSSLLMGYKGDGRRVVRVRVGVNICCEECLVEYLFVCITMKWSDRNVFFEEAVPQIIASRKIGCSVCVCVCCGV